MLNSNLRIVIKNILLHTLLWSVLGFFFVIQQYIYSANVNSPFNWFNNLSYRMPVYILWAPLTPIIYNIVGKLRLNKKFIYKNISILFTAGLIISFIHRFTAIFLAFFIRDYYGELNSGIFEALLNARFAIIGGVIDSLFTYLLILSVVIGLIYYKRLRENEKITSLLQTKLAEAKLDSLKTQLHPHFLFNTLHAVSTLMHKDLYMAEKTLILLSDLLRLSLEHLDHQKITLKDELDFLHKYLDIQSIRFQDKLSVHFNVDSKLYDMAVPSFILQPIVENSIKYAVEPSSEKSCIIISAVKKDNMLSLSVEDSGPGLPDNFSYGIGIENTRSRLKQIYNNNFTLNFESGSGKGLVVEIMFEAEECQKSKS